ncbi:hypothetical protein PFISCL1PPCAC_16247 [Pristionchus fissidentatus]|uniref:Uncharacterized protein n=1 Tax=Pristionchus fissidentatus TaxID=1538716 RepID=A0AAV5VZF9_9BILA|nr:hypothetical protein PFISCL1PPCAC_16247 [Pristionchus fissidentatus]
MSRVSSVGQASAGEERDADRALGLMGIVVEKREKGVGIYNSWIRKKTGQAVTVWDRRDEQDEVLEPGDWVEMVWRRGRVTRVEIYKGAPPMEVKTFSRNGQEKILELRTLLFLLDADDGKHERQLWHEDFGSVGMTGGAATKDMKVGGDPKEMWITWISNEKERNRHLQRTGYDVVWKVSPMPSELPGGGGTSTNGSSRQSDATSLTPTSSTQSAVTGRSGEKEEARQGLSIDEPLSRGDRIRMYGSFPNDRLNRVGIITGKVMSRGDNGHKEGTPIYYVWTPGAPPMFEGRVFVHREGGEEVIRVCDWIRFRIGPDVDKRIFTDRTEGDRFEVLEWQQINPPFPTRCSPNKQTIEVAIRKMVLTSSNTTFEEGGLFYEDEDFGRIADRNGHFGGKKPEEGHLIEFEGVLRRVKPRTAKDSAWMLLTYKVVYDGVDDRNRERVQQQREENGRRHEREERDGRQLQQVQQMEPRRDHHLMQGPKFKGKDVGDVIESTAFVEGFGQSEAFVWLIDAAASGVVNGGASRLKLGDVVYGTFRLQNNGKWGSRTDPVEGDLPHDLSLDVRRDRLFVRAPIIYDALRNEYTNPWFETVFDMERRMPHDPIDKEVYEVELVKTRNEFNISRLLSN